MDTKRYLKLKNNRKKTPLFYKFLKSYFFTFRFLTDYALESLSNCLQLDF